jgi:hypothetical protein
MKVAKNYPAAIEAELPRGTTVKYCREGVELGVPCKHGHTEQVILGKRFPADSVRHILANKGWRFAGSKATCPMHADNTVKEDTVTQMSEAMKAAEQSKQDDKVVSITAPAPTPTAKQAKREALRWLDESFDTVAGRYTDDMSDSKIAEVTGLSVKAVADLRAEFGYDLKTPPEIVALQDQVRAIRESIKAFEDEAVVRIKGLLEAVDSIDRRMARFERDN